jgi:hypothetical protein
VSSPRRCATARARQPWGDARRGPDSDGEHDVVRLFVCSEDEILDRGVTDAHPAGGDLVGRGGSEASCAALGRRLADPWWFKIVAEPGGPAVGTIRVWETRHGDEDLHETGWMVLPAHHGAESRARH